MNLKVNGFSGIKPAAPVANAKRSTKISGANASFAPTFRDLEKSLRSVVSQKQRKYTAGCPSGSLGKRIGFAAGRTIAVPGADFYRNLNGLFASAPEVFSSEAGRETFHELMKLDVAHELGKILEKNQFRKDFLAKTVKDLVTAYKYPSATVNLVLNECRRIAKIRGE